ncbi:MAG: hypothetical protein Q4G21_02260 [Dermabacter sp.]|nr:hypothetical protein [Dermabacter sp.]
MTPTEQRQISRRSIAKGVAWAAPTAVIATAIPAYAVSPKVTGTVCQIFYGGGTVNVQTTNVHLDIVAPNGVPAGTVLTWTVTTDKAVGVPGLSTSGNNGWTLTTNLPKGTSTTSFTVTFRALQDTGTLNCGPFMVWDGSGSAGSSSIPVGTRITVASTTSGTATGDNSSLTWTIPKRASTSIAGPTAMRFVSSSTSCYPPVRYAFMAGNTASYGTNARGCGDNANNSSTIYPNNACASVMIPSGQATIPSRCV